MTSGLVLSFLRRAPDTNDWTQQELAEFYRVEAALLQGGLSVSTDRGISDEGDPWFVFCRADSEEVIAHFARVDREYVIVSSLHSGVARGRDFQLLIRQMIETHPLMLPIRRAQGQKIFLHPASLLIAMLASAYFLASEKEFAGGNSPSDNAKNTSIASLLTQKFGVIAAVGLAVLWLEHQAESAYKFLENAFQGVPLSGEAGSTHVAELAHDAVAALDTAILQAVRDIDLGAHRIDATVSVSQEQNETNVVSKAGMQVASQLVGGADDAIPSPSGAPSLSANGDHVATAHLDVAQNDVDNALLSNNVPLIPAREPVAALAMATQLNQSSAQPSSPSSSVIATSEAVVQLAVSDTSNPSIQPVVLSNGTVPLNVALQQVAGQVGFDTEALHNQSTIDASQASSATAPSTTAALTVFETQILHTVEQFLQNTPSFEVAVSGSNVLIVDTNVADAKSPDYGILTWDLSNGSTLSIVGIIPHHHPQGVVTA
jgi:hypothetical protein